MKRTTFSSHIQCLIFLDDPQAVSDILEKLVKEDNLLMAYQICFDLYESASQQFLSSVIQNLRTVGTPIPAVPGSTNTGTVSMRDKDRWAQEGHENIIYLNLDKALCIKSQINKLCTYLDTNVLLVYTLSLIRLSARLLLEMGNGLDHSLSVLIFFVLLK